MYTALIEIIVKSFLLLFIGLSTYFIVRKSAASLRHTILTYTIIGAVILPIAATHFPSFKIPLYQTKVGYKINRVSPDSAIRNVYAPQLIPYADIHHINQPIEQTPAQSLSLSSPINTTPKENRFYTKLVTPELFYYLWIAVTSIIALRFLWMYLFTWYMVRHSKRVVDLRVQQFIPSNKRVEVHYSDVVSTPMIFGFCPSVLILPHTICEWPDERLQSVILHEAAHINRYDWLTHLVSQIACILYWFNPLVWYVASLMHKEAELACDDAVVVSGIASMDYASHLLETVKHFRQVRPIYTSVTLGERSGLESRIASILDSRKRRGMSIPSVIVSSCVLSVLFIAIASSHLVTDIAIHPKQVAELDRQNNADIQRLACLTDITGPGITVTLRDAKSKIVNGPKFLLTAGIIHDTDINNVVSELKSAGADAISINGERVTTLTTAQCAGSIIDINGKKFVPPFIIKAVGDPSILDSVLRIEGGVYDQLSQLLPSMMDIKTNQSITIHADNKKRVDIVDADSYALFMAGKTNVNGEGVTITLKDSKTSHRNTPSYLKMASLIHDTDINAVISQLKAAGATAVAVNGERITAMSSAISVGPTICINNKAITMPYKIKATGNAVALEQNLKFPGGVYDQLYRIDKDMFSIQREKNVTIASS